MSGWGQRGRALRGWLPVWGCGLLCLGVLWASEPRERDEALHHYLLATEAVSQAQQASDAAAKASQAQHAGLTEARQRLAAARQAVDAATRAAGAPGALPEAVTQLRQAEDRAVQLALRELAAAEQAELAARAAREQADIFAAARQAQQRWQETAQRLGAALPAAAPTAGTEPKATPAVESHGGGGAPLSHSALCPFCRHKANR